MTSKLNLSIAAFAAAISLAPGVSRAQDTGDATNAANENRVLIGAGAFVYRSPFLDEGTTVLPIPLISIRHGNFYFDNLEAGVRHEFSGDPDCIPSIQMFVAARALPGEDRQSITADVRARVSVETFVGNVSVDYRHDASGEFDGGEWTARYEFSVPVAGVTVTTGLQANHQDQKTANHMYGVDSALRSDLIRRRPANSSFAAYRIDQAANNLSADMTFVLPISERLFAIGHVSGTHLDSSIRQNPWVTRDYEVQSLVGLAYRF